MDSGARLLVRLLVKALIPTLILRGNEKLSHIGIEKHRHSGNFGRINVPQFLSRQEMILFIYDAAAVMLDQPFPQRPPEIGPEHLQRRENQPLRLPQICLLYTSDAADDS